MVADGVSISLPKKREKADASRNAFRKHLGRAMPHCGGRWKPPHDL